MAISRIGAVTAAGTSLTPTTGIAGDMMVSWAFNSSSTTIPTVPSGWFTIGSGSGNTCAGVLAYKFCTGTSDASGTWTNATQLIITKYRGVMGIGGLGTPSNATGTSISYPALTAIQTAGNSWIVGAAGHRTASNVSTAPTGMTNVTSVGAGPQAAFHDTNGGVSSWSAQSVTVNASSGHESITAELLADKSTLNPYRKASTCTLSSANLTAASSTNSGGAGQNVFGTLPRSDKRIVKWTITTGQTNDPNIGFGNINSSTAAFVGDSTDSNNSVGWTHDGQLFLNGVSLSSSLGAYSTGDTIYMVADFVNFLFWGKLNSGNWNLSPTADPGNGTPGTGSGGISFSGINSGDFYPLCGFHDGGENVTADFSVSGNPSSVPAWDQSGATTHTSTGALTGPGATVAGTATRFRAHPSTGAIVGPGSTVAGTALRFTAHPSTGALIGPGSAIAGTAQRTGAAVTHPSSGVLVGQGASISGQATRAPRIDPGWPLVEGIRKRRRRRDEEIDAAWEQRNAERQQLKDQLRQAMKGPQQPHPAKAKIEMPKPATVRKIRDSEDEDIEFLLLYG